MSEKTEERRVYAGIGISSGRTCGVLHFFRKAPTPRRRATEGSLPDREKLRLRDALQRAEREIEELQARTRQELGAGEAEIFEIHAMLLQDEDLLALMDAEITKGACAEHAVERAAEQQADILRALGDAYLSARAADLGDIAARLLSILSGEARGPQEEQQQPYILVAEDLTPSETVLLDRSLILGFVTLAGSPTSHTSILARAMGIPALVGVGSINERCDGCMAILDAADGELTVSPRAEELQAFQMKKQAEEEQARLHADERAALLRRPAITTGGHRIRMYANLGDAAEAEYALANGAEGIGLLRSELLYLSRSSYPTEEELFEAYRKTVCAMHGRPVIIRTLDIGADKQADYFELPHEENPALGFRAVRLCLARTQLFKTQLRAILRASEHGCVSVMIPMVVSVEEARRCRRLLEDCREELLGEGIRVNGSTEFGIMVETPAAALMAEELAAEVDFFSVGTNDLTQYTLAADRQNPSLAELCRSNTEPVLRLIRMASEAIHRHDGWIGICGELAADLRLTQRFADMRIDELSVSPPELPQLREQVLKCR